MIQYLGQFGFYFIIIVGFSKTTKEQVVKNKATPDSCKQKVDFVGLKYDSYDPAWN